MNRGRPGHRLGVTKCNTCGNVITSSNAVWMKASLRGQCSQCFKHEAVEKRTVLFDGNESKVDPFGQAGKVLMR